LFDFSVKLVLISLLAPISVTIIDNAKSVLVNMVFIGTKSFQIRCCAGYDQQFTHLKYMATSLPSNDSTSLLTPESHWPKNQTLSPELKRHPELCILREKKGK
jgi:hypothetical protein